MPNQSINATRDEKQKEETESDHRYHGCVELQFVLRLSLIIYRLFDLTARLLLPESFKAEFIVVKKTSAGLHGVEALVSPVA